MNENKRLIETYNWNAAELEILQQTPIQMIYDKIANLSDEVYDNLMEAFNSWIFDHAPKSKLNRWLKKANLTIEELNIWCTL